MSCDNLHVDGDAFLCNSRAFSFELEDAKKIMRKVKKGYELVIQAHNL